MQLLFFATCPSLSLQHDLSDSAQPTFQLSGGRSPLLFNE
jgi:hypothetical protein